jgi:hypothetical protein
MVGALESRTKNTNKVFGLSMTVPRRVKGARASAVGSSYRVYDDLGMRLTMGKAWLTKARLHHRQET